METLRLELFTRDIDATASFFERALGFAAGPPSHGYRALTLGNVTVGLGLVDDLPPHHPLRPAVGEPLGRGVEIVIECDDVDAAFQRTRDSGYPIAGALAARPWGLRDFRVITPDGYYVRVTSR